MNQEIDTETQIGMKKPFSNTKVYNFEKDCIRWILDLFLK